MAAAGLWTTATDLARFVIAIQNALRGQPSGPIDASIAREMTTPFAGAFGLGLEDTSDSFSHSGANEGFQGIFLGLLRSGRGVAVMTNSDNGLRLAYEIVNSVAMAYDWPVLRPTQKTALSLEPAALSAYAGSYHAQFHSTDVALDIRADGSELVIRFSADGLEERVYAETPTRFFTLEGAVLVFSRDAAGKVVSVAVSGVTFARRP